MATTNVALTTAWAKVVTLGDAFFISLPFSTRNTMEIAAVATDTAPVVEGHKIRGDRHESITRDLIGPGYVYARLETPGTVIASIWTPA